MNIHTKDTNQMHEKINDFDVVNIWH